MSENADDTIAVGTHVIVKKQSYSKVYKVSENGILTLGKDQVEMREIIGKPFWSTFEMTPSRNGNRTFTLKPTDRMESWDDLKGDQSGQDNRLITDDGTSQKLSKEEILQLQETAKTGKEIIGSLIENSTSFAAKTEYSQEKYIKKKERKYFRFLTVCKPTVVSLHEIYFRVNKIGGLRMDSLAQILSYNDVQSDGVHILYDSGSQGLPAAAMLDRIGVNTSGHLINLHPGNMPQIAVVQAMNFPQELKDRHVLANIYSFLRLYYQGESSLLSSITEAKNTVSNKMEKSEESEKTTDKVDDNSDLVSDLGTKDVELEGRAEVDVASVMNEESANNLKRKINESEDVVPAKKPKWFLETQRAMDLLGTSKARGLTIVAKEHPLNIITALLPFLGASRPFVIFHAHREPLQETYMELKQKRKVLNLRLFTNFLRSYQVLPERTHPNILTSDTGGYILTGYLVE